MSRQIIIRTFEIVFERFGNSSLPLVFLIMGGCTQMITWPEAFCKELVDKGLQVIRFDKRDTGHSSQFAASPEPDFAAAMAGNFSSVASTLYDMAADTVGLMVALGFDTMDLVGASMGGMKAQTMAIEYRAKLKSLTYMMSTTGKMS